MPCQFRGVERDGVDARAAVAPPHPVALEHATLAGPVAILVGGAPVDRLDVVREQELAAREPEAEAHPRPLHHRVEMVERLALARVERRARQLHARLDHHPRVVDADLLADALEDGLHDGARARGPGVEVRRQEVEGPVEDLQEVRSLGEHRVVQRRGGGDHALAASARRVHAEQADIAGRPRLEAAIVGVHRGQAVARAEPRGIAVRRAPVGHREEPPVGAQSLPHRLAEIVREAPADYPRLVLREPVEVEAGQDR